MEDRTIKGIISAILVVAIIYACGFTEHAQAKYSGGSGEPNDPYQIADVCDLMTLANDTNDYNKCFIMTSDINLDPCIPGNKTFTAAVIAPDINSASGFQGTPFNGIFDGAGHNIVNLTIDTNGTFLGLFGDVNSGDIRNLNLKNFKITLRYNSSNYPSYCGALAGRLINSDINNCFSTGDINTENASWFIGGLVGWSSGTIRDSRSTCNITGGNYIVSVGGLVGWSSGSINNCSSICNLIAEYSPTDIGGLVGSNDGSISDCFSSGTVTGGEIAWSSGGLVGNNSGYINNSYSSSNVIVGNVSYNSGGLAGYVDGDISCSFSTGSVNCVSGAQLQGGFVGYFNSGNIRSCYSTGDVTCGDWAWCSGGFAGILGGDMCSYAAISDSYSTGKVNVGNDSQNLGGFIGRIYCGDANNCYSTGIVSYGSGQNFVGGFSGYKDNGNIRRSYFLITSGPDNHYGVPLTDAQMKQQASFIGWDFVNIWRIDEGTDYPKLRYSKYSGGSGEPNDPYQITNVADLMTLANDANDYNKCFIMTADIDLDPCLPSRQIFSTAVIARDIDDNSWDFQGTPFSGIFNGAGHKILHLNIDGGSNDFLGLFGKVTGGQIKNLGVENVYIARNTLYAYFHGGIVGSNNGSLSKCYSTGKLYGGYFLTCYGGLVGQNDSNGSIDNCYSDVNVLVDGWEGIGQIGGLVGENNGIITNCYSVGPVPLYGGGLVGYNKATVTASFWDVNTSGKSSSSGGISKTTAQMKNKSTFTDYNWDFNNIWAICESTNYPRLIWQIPPADFVCPDGVNLADYSFFADHWLDANCSTVNNCDGTDFDLSGDVDLTDLANFVESWLVGI